MRKFLTVASLVYKNYITEINRKLKNVRIKMERWHDRKSNNHMR